jgi:predicted DNA-binding transcriptional regulator AlpA
MQSAEVWLTRPQLAERLQVSVKTLAMWACRGEGPRYARPGGGRVRYRLSDVMGWEAAQFSDGAA